MHILAVLVSIAAVASTGRRRCSMELSTYPSTMPVNKPCFICSATVQVPALYSNSNPAICSECYQAIAWAKEKMKEQQNER